MAWKSFTLSTYPWRLTMHVLYKNIQKDQITKLKQVLDEITLEPYDETKLKDEVTLLFIGEEGHDLIPTLQKVNLADPDLSIIIIPSNPYIITNLKASIQFAPFIGKNFTIINSLNQPDLREIIDEQTNLTVTRRKFRKTKENSVRHLGEAFKLDASLKSKFLDKFLSKAPVGVILLDEDFTLLDFNNYTQNSFPNITNFKSKTIFDLFPNNKKKLQKFFNESHSDEDGLILDLNYLKGNVKYVRLHHSTINTSNILYHLLIFSDITKEKDTEKKNEDYLQNLERHNKELEQFAFIVTHDLKNPLSTINLSCEMAEEGTAEEKDHYLNIIHRSAKNLLQMLEGLEVMIDVRRDKNQDFEKLILKDVLDHVLNEYQYKIRSSNIKLSTDFKYPKIQYIESYLFSILHNLISNAIKYSRENVPLHLSIESEKKGNYVLLKISDNGIGIDLEKHRNNLFQPFRRLTQQAEGKGIGLSLIKTMIEKNGGKLEVESEPNKGTTFLCYLCEY